MIFRKSTSNKRGFSLAEAVVALLIISIVTAGALTLISSSQKATQTALEKQQAQFYAADIITCYRAENFEESLQFAFGEGCKQGDKIFLPGDMVATVVETDNTLSVIIKKGETQLTAQSFTKGGAQ